MTVKSTISSKLSALKPKHWVLIGLGVTLLIFAILPGGGGIDPNNWNCENLKDDIIAMSKDEDLEVLEIGDLIRDPIVGYRKIECVASAEWSRGYGLIEYGGHISDGGSVILQYRQN